MRISRDNLTLVLALFLLAIGRATADTLNAIDSGSYDSLGLHNPLEVGYFVGFPYIETTNPVEYRNFFVFDTSGISQPQTSATLRAFAYRSGGFSDGGAGVPLTWSIYDVSSSATAIMQGSGGQTAFEDLGTGILLGSASVTQDRTNYGNLDLPLRGRYIDVVLNPAGVAYLNAHLGGLVFFGGRIDRVNGTSNYLFANSDIGQSYHPTQLVTTVPVPAAAWLFGSAVACLGIRRRRALT